MADEDKNKKPVDAKVEEVKAPESTPPVAQTAPALPTLSAADAHLIATIAAQVSAQMASNHGKPAVRTAGSDVAPRGGKYIVEGKAVNSWGNEYVEGRDPLLDDPLRPKF